MKNKKKTLNGKFLLQYIKYFGKNLMKNVYLILFRMRTTSFAKNTQELVSFYFIIIQYYIFLIFSRILMYNMVGTGALKFQFNI